MAGKNKILLIVLSLSFVIVNVIHAQGNKPQSSNFKLEHFEFMSSIRESGNADNQLFGILGDVFVKTGSSQNFQMIGGPIISARVVTSAEDVLNSGQPDKYELMQNYPNPFNPTTRVKYAIPEDGIVNLTVYNVIGQSVHELVNEYQKAGYYEVNFNANNLSSGFYIYRITSGTFSATRKMLLIK